MRRSVFTLASMMLFLLLSFAASLSAAWVEDIPESYTQPDGVVVEYFSSGDEYYHWAHDAQGYKMMYDTSTGYMCWAVIQGDKLVSSGFPIHLHTPESISEATQDNISEQGYGVKRELWNEAAARSAFSPTRAAPTTGNLVNLVIFIKFQDQTNFPHEYSAYNNRFNQTGAGVSSLKQYYETASYGQLSVHSPIYPTPNQNVIACYTAPYDYDYFLNLSWTVANITTWCNMLRGAVNAVAGQVTQSASELDANNDSRIDNVFFIIRGNANSKSEYLWSHRYALYYGSPAATIKGKTAFDYVMVMENHAMSSSATYGVGVLVHEYGHTLGAPDFYTYSSITPIGAWEVMANTSNPPQALSSYIVDSYYNWISVPEVVKSGTYTLTPFPANQTGSALKIRSPYATNQYFMVENRQKTSSLTDSTLPGSGLLISRCVPYINGNSPNNQNITPYELYVYRPNGTISTNGTISSAAYGTAGRTAINDDTTPSSFIYTSTNSGGVTNTSTAGGLDISNISLDTATKNVTFTVNMRNEPTGVSNTVANGNSVTVRWNAPTLWGTPAGYRVYRNGELLTQSNLSSSARSYTDNSPMVGSNVYTVTTVYNGSVLYGESAHSASTTAIIQGMIESPQNLTATEHEGYITLQWTAVESSIGYRVYRNNTLISGVITSTSYNDSNITHSTTYSYHVTAVYRSGESAPSNVVTITTTTPPAPLYPPENLIATEHEGYIALQWTAIESAIGYKVYKNGVAITQAITNVTYNDSHITHSTTYTYFVTALYGHGESEPSNVVAITTATPPPPPPTELNPPQNLTVASTPGKVVLHWEAPVDSPNAENLVFYKIYRNDRLLRVVNAETLSYHDVVAIISMRYTYYVTAEYTNGTSPASNSVTTTVLHPNVWLPPRDLTATEGQGEISLQWLTPTPAVHSATLVGYLVYRDGNPLVEVGVVLEYSDTNVVAGVEYTYQVAAIYTNPDGVSVLSNTVAATAQEIETDITLYPPQNLTATTGHRQVILAWEAPSYIAQTTVLSGYIIYRNGVQIAQTDSQRYIDTAVVINIRYTYYVVAVYSTPEGISEPSNSAIGFAAIIPTMSGKGMTSLHDNYPNPFNPETTISFTLANDAPVQIEICNIKGQVVRSLVNRHMSAGTHSVVWNGKDNDGHTVSSGMYFYRLSAGEHQSMRKMMLLK